MPTATQDLVEGHDTESRLGKDPPAGRLNTEDFHDEPFHCSAMGAGSSTLAPNPTAMQKEAERQSRALRFVSVPAGAGMGAQVDPFHDSAAARFGSCSREGGADCHTAPGGRARHGVGKEGPTHGEEAELPGGPSHRSKLAELPSAVMPLAMQKLAEAHDTDSM